MGLDMYTDNLNKLAPFQPSAFFQYKRSHSWEYSCLHQLDFEACPVTSLVAPWTWRCYHSVDSTMWNYHVFFIKNKTKNPNNNKKTSPKDTTEFWDSHCMCAMRNTVHSLPHLLGHLSTGSHPPSTQHLKARRNSSTQHTAEQQRLVLSTPLLTCTSLYVGALWDINLSCGPQQSLRSRRWRWRAEIPHSCTGRQLVITGGTRDNSNWGNNRLSVSRPTWCKANRDPETRHVLLCDSTMPRCYTREIHIFLNLFPDLTQYDLHSCVQSDNPTVWVRWGGFY